MSDTEQEKVEVTEITNTVDTSVNPSVDTTAGKPKKKAGAPNPVENLLRGQIKKLKEEKEELCQRMNDMLHSTVSASDEIAARTLLAILGWMDFFEAHFHGREAFFPSWLATEDDYLKAISDGYIYKKSELYNSRTGQTVPHYALSEAGKKRFSELRKDGK